MTIALVLAAIALPAASGVAAVLLRARPAAAQRLACALVCAGSAAGIAAAVGVLARGAPGGAAAPALALGLDGLSAAFLAALSALAAAGAVYGLAYHPQAALGGRAVRVQLFYGLAVGGMALLVAATNAIVFLVGWEVMALSNFFLVLTDDERPEVQRAAFLYLAATHVGTLALFAVFALLGQAAGSFAFEAWRGVPAAGAAGARAFAFALVGFGLKAGLVPLHFWLPPAHAAAPSHVSSLMSGVVVKMGLYGLLRVAGLLDAPPAAWGWALLAAGGVSAVLGVAFALAQHDLKRLLAYHTVENVGIIAMGAGLALLGRARGEPALVLLGFSGAVLHVVNHALFKGLLFLGAGAVQHATGTRDLDHLGGLAKGMRATAVFFTVGAAAIAGLPPLNGFVSEWLVALGFLHGVGRPGGDALAFVVLGAPVLALVGGLAAACFAKVVGVVFLGSPRSEHAGHAHEPPLAMRAPMAALAAACAAIGLAPAVLVAPLRDAAAAWSGLDPAALAEPAARAAEGATRISLVAAALAALAAVAVLARRGVLARGRAAATATSTATPTATSTATPTATSTATPIPTPTPALVETWGCGFAAPTARMQYTGSSFAELLVRRFSWAMVFRGRAPTLSGPFPRAGEHALRTEVPDTVLDLALLPAARGWAGLATRARLLYLRRVQFQMLLVVLTLLAILAWGFAW
ncbi:MAG TPA: proton-conducting transporter membrane subunit [Anaeromyxobacter sp.]|nr:proton-conducting transporter membrane subunit [Anaeromyxobacter sp.]